MNCPKCNSSNGKIINSRKRDVLVWRVRKCLDCSHSWRTNEMSEEDMNRLLNPTDEETYLQGRKDEREEIINLLKEGLI
jgi:transcriptional regulator NrdR family protein